jgi:hypothetical protein
MIRWLSLDWKTFLIASLLSISLTSTLSMVPSFAASKGYQEAQPEAQKVQQPPQIQQVPATQPVQQVPQAQQEQQTKQEPQAKPDTATQVLPAKTFKHQKW